MKHPQSSRERKAGVARTKKYIEDFVLDVFKTPTERDLQVEIGASNMSSLCDKCLAEDMLGDQKERSEYWAGAAIGTAIHGYLEERLLTHPGLREKYATVRPEFKVSIGTIPEYGEIKSTSDLYFEDIATVGDYKTTTKDTMVYIRKVLTTPPSDFESDKMRSVRAKLTSYTYQAMLYGLGYENAGETVEWVSLIFICRNASGDNDIEVHVQPYNRDIAEAVFDRAVRLWDWLASHDTDELESDEDCWYCNNVRPRN